VRYFEFAKNRSMSESVAGQGFGQGLGDGMIIGYSIVFLLSEILYILSRHQDDN